MAQIIIREENNNVDFSVHAQALCKIFEQNLSDEWLCYPSIIDNEISYLVVVGPDIGVLVLNIKNQQDGFSSSITTEIQNASLDSLSDVLRMTEKLCDTDGRLLFPLSCGYIFTYIIGNEDSLEIDVPDQFVVYADELSELARDEDLFEERLYDMQIGTEDCEVEHDLFEVLIENIPSVISVLRNQTLLSERCVPDLTNVLDEYLEPDIPMPVLPDEYDLFPANVSTGHDLSSTITWWKSLSERIQSDFNESLYREFKLSILEGTLDNIYKLGMISSLSISYEEKVPFDLKVLNKFKKLKSLQLNNLSEIVCSEDIHNVTRLIVYGNNDTSFLKKFINLEKLIIDSPKLDSFEHVATLLNLRELEITPHCSITDISPLGKLKKLRLLNLSDCIYLTDLQPLENLTVLEVLNLSKCYELNNIGQLKKLTNLKELKLNYLINLKDISPLSVLKNLKTLHLFSCYKINNIEPIGKLDSLKELRLDDCFNITSISPLSELENIEILSFGNLKKISTLAPLQRMSVLKYLSIRGCDDLRDQSRMVLANLSNLQEYIGRGGTPNMKGLVEYLAEQIETQESVNTSLNYENHAVIDDSFVENHINFDSLSSANKIMKDIVEMSLDSSWSGAVFPTKLKDHISHFLIMNPDVGIFILQVVPWEDEQFDTVFHEVSMEEQFEIFEIICPTLPAREEFCMDVINHALRFGGKTKELFRKENNLPLPIKVGFIFSEFQSKNHYIDEKYIPSNLIFSDHLVECICQESILEGRLRKMLDASSNSFRKLNAEEYHCVLETLSYYRPYDYLQAALQNDPPIVLENGAKYWGECDAAMEPVEGNAIMLFPTEEGGVQKYIGRINFFSEREGEGTYVWPNGQKYSGEYNDGKYNGQGTFTYNDGDAVSGEFKDNELNGIGEVVLANGCRFIGRIKETWLVDGQYIYINNDGERYIVERDDGEVKILLDYADALKEWESISTIWQKVLLDSINKEIITDGDFGENILKIQSLEKIDCSDSSSISSLEGICSIKELKVLDFSYTEVSDLSPLKELVKLETLVFKNCELVYNLKPIEELSKLKKLVFSGCDLLESIVPLQNLVALEELDIKNCTNIKHMHPVRNLINLRKFDCSYTSVDTLDALSEMIHLEVLYCRHLEKLTDISTLPYLPELKRLRIDGSWVVNNNYLKYLCWLPTLYELHLDDSNEWDYFFHQYYGHVEFDPPGEEAEVDLEPLSSFQSLVVLKVQHKSVKNFSSLSSLKNLVFLNSNTSSNSKSFSTYFDTTTSPYLLEAVTYLLMDDFDSIGINIVKNFHNPLLGFEIEYKSIQLTVIPSRGSCFLQYHTWKSKDEVDPLLDGLEYQILKDSNLSSCYDSDDYLVIVKWLEYRDYPTGDQENILTKELATFYSNILDICEILEGKVKVSIHYGYGEDVPF